MSAVEIIFNITFIFLIVPSLIALAVSAVLWVLRRIIP